VPESESSTRLVLATPLFVQSASSKPLGLLGRRRMRQELARIHGVRGRDWQPQLSPADRSRVYVPLSAALPTGMAERCSSGMWRCYGSRGGHEGYGLRAMTISSGEAGAGVVWSQSP
jgi:hypothetical protein